MSDAIRSFSMSPLSFIDGRRRHGKENKAGLSLVASCLVDNFFFANK